MRGTVATTDRSSRPVGLAWLHENLGLRVPPPAVRSEIVDGGRSSYTLEHRVVERYPRQYEPTDVAGHLRFALKYEPLDIRVLSAALAELGGEPIRAWLELQPTGGYARRAWYLYEVLLDASLDFPDASVGGYVTLANPEIQIVGDPGRSKRHRVEDNLLGAPAYSPLVRLTPTLREALLAPLSKRAQELVRGIDPAILARASQYLYTRETKSSFLIEREELSKNYLERFVQILGGAKAFKPTEDNLVRLQNAIVDPRFAENGWRKRQNYVGETRADYQEAVHFVCPRPEDVPQLMAGWASSLDWMETCHPVVAAAAASFGFVLIHPFEDGNGRIHRFLIHSILASGGFTPEDLIFPVSAVMLRHRREYERLLDSHSETIMPYIEYTLNGPGDLVVHNDTIDLYRYPDLTSFAEYLFACIEETIDHDLTEELGFLTRFDAARTALREVVDLPDVRARMLLNFLLQNGGRLSKSKRKDFEELTDEEIESIEAAVQPYAAG